ncbi:hypothetical protein K438DRAFT_1978489 [Mycena galopus ATCC 62051]|nr:hypothetical protein K438DRAFT_1978489 [Mycena galopus ATCC 62051]
MSSLFGSAPAAPAETCMSLQASCLTGPQSQSFEEVRIADYLASYRSIGRLPPPCPSYPPDALRKGCHRSSYLCRFPLQQGHLPLLFQAHRYSGQETQSGARRGRVRARLLLPQTFVAPVPVGAGSEPESFTSIVAAPETPGATLTCSGLLSLPFIQSTSLPCLLTPFPSDFRELHFHAYLRGMRAPPPGAPVFALAPVSDAPAPAFPGASALPVPNAGDTFMTITTRPEFAGHSVEVRPRSVFRNLGSSADDIFSPSFPPCPRSASLIPKSQPTRELCLAWLCHGTELTSAQIFATLGGAPSSQSQLAPPANPLLRVAHHGVHVRPPRPRRTIRCPPAPTQPAQPVPVFSAPTPAQPVFGAVQAQAQPPSQEIFGRLGARSRA